MTGEACVAYKPEGVLPGRHHRRARLDHRGRLEEVVVKAAPVDGWVAAAVGGRDGRLVGGGSRGEGRRGALLGRRDGSAADEATGAAKVLNSGAGAGAGMVLLGISTRTAGAAKMLTSNEGAGAVTGLPGFS